MIDTYAQKGGSQRTLTKQLNSLGKETRRLTARFATILAHLLASVSQQKGQKNKAKAKNKHDKNTFIAQPYSMKFSYCVSARLLIVYTMNSN